MKHVKENDLAHGEYGKWLEKVNISKDYSAKYIKVFNEFNNSNFASTRNIGITALYELSQIPEEERTKEHMTKKGEVKTPDEMTVKELNDLKKQLKQRDEQNAQLQSQVEQAHLTTETLFYMWLNSMYTRNVVLYLHNMISTINNNIPKACTCTVLQ